MPPRLSNRFVNKINAININKNVINTNKNAMNTNKNVINTDKKCMNINKNAMNRLLSRGGIGDDDG